MKGIFIGLGTNLGDRQENLDQACTLLRGHSGIRIVKKSSRYRTTPWGKTDQPDFLNQVAELESKLSPRQLLHELQRVESHMGRRHVEKWGPRIIDLDLLLYGDQVIDEPDLQVPHPYLRVRPFVIIPLLEIAPELVLPDGTQLRSLAFSLDKSQRDSVTILD